jgi:N utilization substance protein A
MDLSTVKNALTQLAEEKGLPRDKIVESIELALAAAYKRDYGERGQIVRAHFDLESGAVSFEQVKIVVDEPMLKKEDEEEATPEALAEAEPKIVFNPERHIMIDEARKIKSNVQQKEELIFPLETKQDYGRIAAQTAKQVIIQRLREAEREAVWEEFQNREGEVISGIVQRVEGRHVYVDVGRTVAILPVAEQVSHERYRVGERIKALVVFTEKSAKGTGIFLSRAHPRFVIKLFEIEVPEIAQGAVEIVNIAREAGSRSKVAVQSNAEGVDPVGSLVGQKGVRVNTVISELGGEKIDVIEWSDDPEVFITSALAPAKIDRLTLDHDRKIANVMVDASQLSLAIGRGGQNVRLAAKLTGWKIEVRPSSS